MSEFEQSGYQTTENVEQVNETPIQQESAQVESQEPATTQEPNYFTVKYNKEERQVSYDEAPEYIQKGLNYEKVNQRVSEYEQRLQDIAQITGYQTTDELFQAMELAKQQQQEEMYRQAGIDPNTLNQFLEQHPDIQYARKMKAKQEEEQRFQQEANELFQEFPDLKADQIPQEVWQIKEQRGLSLLDAYLRVSYKNLGQQKEQEAIQKLQSNAVSSPGSLGGGDVNHVQSVSKLSSSDFNSIVDQVLRGERRQL